jgi:hypothetical protein
MANDTKEKRLALNDYKAARRSLARVLRMRFRGEIDSATFRDMVYGLHCLLGFDKLQKETELEKRMSELENKRGRLTLSITPEEAIGLDPDEREQRIMELLQKGKYAEKLATFVAGPVPDPATSDVTPPDPVMQNSAEPDPDSLCENSDKAIQPEQPQPRRLKL